MATIKQRLDWAFENQEKDPVAKEYVNRYRKGLLNPELQKEGMQPVNIPKPKLDLTKVMGVAPNTSESMMSKIPDDGIVKRTVQDIPSDFSEMGETLRSGLEKTGQNILEKATKEDRSLAEKATMVGGETLKGIGRFVGNSLIGLGKLALPQSLEDSISEGVEKFGGKIAEESLKFIERVKESDHPIDQAVVAKLDEMVNRYKTDDRFRDQVDAGAGFAEGLLELYGTGKAVSATKEAAETIVDTGTAAYKATAPVVTDVVQQTFENAKDFGTKVINKADELVQTRKANVETAKAQAERDMITDLVAPGLDKAEFRKALDEGRATRGQRGFWIGKKPDSVDVADKVVEIADTVQRTIPGASKLDDATLVPRLKTQIETIASDLEPKMREVKLRDVTPSETPIVKVAKQYKTADDFVGAFNRGELDVQTVELLKKEYGDDIFDDVSALKDLYTRAQNPSMIDVALDVWARLKKVQSTQPEFLDYPSNKAFQERFENYLTQITKGTNEKTLADLWKVRKDYDASIPDRIKNATEMSPIQSQLQKQMWLENRRILNDIINDTTRGLGQESQQAFKDMSNLYSARENIISKANMDKKGGPGVFGKTKEAIIDRAIPFGLGSIIF